MKHLFFGLFVIMLPQLLMAQQPDAPLPPQPPQPPQKETFSKEMETMQQQLKQQMKVLQDSVAALSRRFSESAAARDLKGAFHEGFNDTKPEWNLPPLPDLPPVPPLPDLQEALDNALEEWRERDFRFEMPAIPELEEGWGKALDEFKDFHFRFEGPEPPEVPFPEDAPRLQELENQMEHLQMEEEWRDRYSYPGHHEKRHQQILEMLPFYQFFKS
ncbi:MAG: hypothetical protein IPO83_03225 [Chitinophagaceae bacterium]|nr:hypothetical protein [Chitinophagaceae bacterium]